MKIKKAAVMAEIVSAIAVVVSLPYVGHEVQQNTAAVKSTACQSIHDAEVLSDTKPHLSDPFNELLISR